MQNDMRDRLVELLINADVYDSYECKLCTKEDYCDYCNAEKLADYLITNGVIVPPCKVGGTIYTISINREIEEYVVSGVCLYRDGWFVEFYYEDYSIHIDDVFLTKDQAEQKLKELSEQDA